MEEKLFQAEGRISADVLRQKEKEGQCQWYECRGDWEGVEEREASAAHE